MSNAYRFLIVDTYYNSFLSSLYGAYPHLSTLPYREQISFIMESCFGTADFYSKNLQALGCDAEDVIPNNLILQKQWALEHSLNLDKRYLSQLFSRIPYMKHFIFELDIPLTILKHQIKMTRPDVLYIQDLSYCPAAFLSSLKKDVKLLVGQIACPLPDAGVFAPYDLILSSLPHYVEMFRSMGLKSEYFRIGFESSILQRLGEKEAKYDVIHIGGYGPVHNERNQLLEEVAKEVDVHFWGYGADNLAQGSTILRNYRGESWGIDRYRLFRQSRIIITKHISSVAQEFCNNMTLFEATGTGALLVTDQKKNLPDLFIPGKEVVAYNSPAEATDLIKHYLCHEAERSTIAANGQARTLNEHSYYIRMQELLEIIKRYI